jgi:RNA polymerase sigma-70 factor (ECF subfamily)
VLRRLSERSDHPVPSGVRPAANPQGPPRLGEAFPGILGAARLGAEWAWNAIYRNLAPVVFGYLCGVGARDAEDLTGEVFLQVARDLPSFAGGESEFRSWMLVMAHHRFLDQRRYDARRPVQPAPPDAIAERGSTGDVEDEALGNLATEHVRRLIEALTPDQRDILLLRILGGFTVDEVAAMIGKRPSAVKALQRRGLGAIRRALAKEQGSV